VRASRIPRSERILLLDPAQPITRWRLVQALYLTRWAGQLPRGGVLTPTGMTAGACGHYAFTRWRFLLHRHRDHRPMTEDMKAALSGTGPVPAWFWGAGDQQQGPE
jgi:hypothetical protein